MEKVFPVRETVTLQAVQAQFCIVTASAASAKEGKLLGFARHLAATYEITRPLIQVTPLERYVCKPPDADYLYLITITRG